MKLRLPVSLPGELAGYFTSAPFVPLAAALLAGVLCGTGAAAAAAAGACGIIALAMLLLRIALRLYLHYNPTPGSLSLGYRLRHTVWIPVLLATFAFGNMMLRLSYFDAETAFSETGAYASARVIDVTRGTGGDRCIAEVDGLADFSGTLHSIRGFKALVTADAIAASAGDRIVFPGIFEPTSGYGDPQLFDYEAYMYGRGIDWVAHLRTRDIQTTGRHAALTATAAGWRDALVELCEHTSLRRESKDMLAAILLGDRQMLGSDVRDEFAGAGIAHLLAVSGLHVGVIALICSMLFLPLGLIAPSWLRHCATMAAIILFALLTGMSTPVLRATVMSCCVIVGIMLQRPRSSLNLLCCAACVIICLSPRAPYDIGFQLSFAATWCVISLCPLFSRRLSRSWQRTVADAVGVPLLIFLVTWPLTARVFHEVSLLFLPANLLAVPLLPVYFLVSALFIGLTALGWEPTLLGHAIDWFSTALTEGAAMIASRVHSHQSVWISDSMTWVYIIFIAIAAYALFRSSRTSRYIAVAAFACCLAVFMGGPRSAPADGYMISDSHLGLNVTVYNSGNVSRAEAEAGRIRLLDCAGSRLVWLDRSLGRDSTAAAPFPCDALIIGGNCRDDAAAILRRIAPRHVILHPSLQSEVAVILGDEMALRSIPCHDLAQSGQYRFTNPEKFL